MCKKIKRLMLSILLLCFIFICIGCNKDEQLVDEENIDIKDIVSSHTLYEEDLNIYLLLQSIPEKENDKVALKQSITIYSDFLKGNRTSRHYSFYQVDYKTEVLNRYFHIFDFTNEANKRSYAQCFLPFSELDSSINEISVLFKYSYMIGEEVFEKEASFKENMIVFDKDKFNNSNIDSGYDISISIVENGDEYKEEENFNRYKLSLIMSDENKQKDGHIDFCAFVKFSDGNIYSLYSLYHYNFNRSDYVSVRDTKVSKQFEIEEVYYVIEEHLSSGEVNKIYIKE